MDVKAIFELRKQGRIEEAYAAIRPIYAQHKGHYTTIAMFWVGVDMMRLRYQQRRLEEAYKIFQSLLRLYPTMDDRDYKGQTAMMRAAILVFDHDPAFSMLDFITEWGIERLSEEDWIMGQTNGHLVPSTAIRIVGKVFKEVEAKPTVDMALKAVPILNEALKHSPYNMNFQRHKALIYQIMGKKDKAIHIYRRLIQNHKRQSYLFHEFSKLVDNPQQRIALLCKAISTQRDERFNQHMRFVLAGLLYDVDKSRARYELDKCLETRRKAGYTVTWEMQNLEATLAETPPVSEASEREFYRQQEAIVWKI